ncbi:AI-2E family transporter [Exiguobacterium himgiriensis]|uniref:AI-2E family transporter n=1 Tax=Exiguobacterium sp. s122 TaxID=2751220 RepID=UPI002037078A|nr:AI-2E family transporter [Exiguobacterium sp. s122]MCT4782365.1 AI-2E family transporter [Exiguobacterium himgiriensis]
MIWKLTVIGLILLVLWRVISEPDTISRVLQYTFQLLTPVIMGIAIALLLNTVLSYMEERFALKRYQSLSIVYVTFIGLLVISAVTLFPRIYSSVSSLIEELPFYIRQLDGFVSQLNVFLQDYNETIAQTLDFKRFEERYSGWVETAVLSSVGYVSSFTMTLINFLIGIVISIYLLKDKEVFARMFKRLLYAMFPVATAKTTIDIFQEMDYIFKRYIIGKSLDCLIIGVMAVIGLLIIGAPYALLLGVIIGILNFIPYVGPLLGMIPAFIITYFYDPFTAVLVLVFIFLLQQFDGLWLGPKILGDSVGITPFWVITSIIIGGSLFGLVGMFISVPVTAMIQVILSRIIDYRLSRKNLNELL